MSTLPDHFSKLVIHQLTGDFRSSTSVTTQAWVDPGPGEVVVRNRWAGCNAIFDKNLCRNSIRYVDVKPPYDMGIEAVGEIVKLGPGVTGWALGDAVATTRLGSGYREYQVADTSRLVRVREASPEILTLVPTGISGMVGLERIGEMRGGETIAVSAAAGGLGHIVVQIAKLAGAHVIGLTGRDDKAELLRSLGVDRVVNYRSEDLRKVLAEEYPRGLDIAYDSVGGEIFDAFLDNLAMRGRLIISGHTSDFDKPAEDVLQPRIYRKLYWKSASVRAFQNQAFREYFDDTARRILELYYAGRLKVLVDPTPFDGLESVADASEYILAGRNTGKVVIRIGA
ncbi:MAG: zinc-binding dehydrogenase [Steroidobacteraceae bacterium]